MEKLFFVLTSCIICVYCTHFDGGFFTAFPLQDLGTQYKVQVRIRLAYRTSHGSVKPSTMDCNPSRLGLPTGHSGMKCDIYCQIGCNIPNQLLYKDWSKCVAYSVQNDWSYGEDQFIIYVNKDIIYEARHTGGTWRSLVEYTVGYTVGAENWELRFRLNTTTRPDTGTMNRSPVTLIPPVLLLKTGQIYILEIPTLDDDGDIVRCRWAEHSKNECFSICNSVSIGVLDKKNCTITFDMRFSNPTPGWYGAALQLEDFKDNAAVAANEVISSVPLQFLINLAPAVQNCTTLPILPTFGCKVVSAGATIKFDIVANVTCKGGSITEITVTGPFGMTYSETMKVKGNKNQWYTTINWTPSTNQIGQHIVCFLAIDDTPASSLLSCMTVDVTQAGIIPIPVIITNAGKPSGILSSSVLLGVGSFITYETRFSEYVSRPHSSKYIHIQSQDGSDVFKFDVTNSSQVDYINNSTCNCTIVKFKIPIYSLCPDLYYVEIDEGAGIYEAPNSTCYTESPSERTLDFWNFTIPSVPPTILNNITCVETIFGSSLNDLIYGQIGYAGASFMNSINISITSTAISQGILTQNFTKVNGSLWYEGYKWTPLERGTYTICTQSYDSCNLTSSQVCFNATVIDKIYAQPVLQYGTGSPFGLLNTSFVVGSNSYFTFSIKFNNQAFRPTKPTYIKIYLANGTQYLKIDCSSSVFVYYINDQMFFDIKVTQLPEGSYYVLFDEGVGTVPGCKSMSPAVTNTTFWRFQIPYIPSLRSTVAPKYVSCGSTKCNVPSMLLLLGLFSALTITGHLLFWLLLLKLRPAPPKPEFFKLYIPVSYDLHLN